MNVETYHYDPTKDLVHLPGTIWGPLGEQRLRFVFDPGAFCTIIDTSLMDSLGYQAIGVSRKVGTTSAIGREWGYTTVVQKLGVLSFTFPNIEAACFDLPKGSRWMRRSALETWHYKRCDGLFTKIGLRVSNTMNGWHKTGDRIWKY